MQLKKLLGCKKKERLANLPVFCMFCIFPFISIIAKFTGLGMLNYDPFWIVAFFVAFFPIHNIIGWFQRSLFFILLFVLMKYGYAILQYDQISVKAWAMDIKWIIYLLFSMLWVSKHGFPNCDSIYNCSLFFSKVYILFTIFRYLVLKEEISRDGILMEANYDGFMILMGFCLCGELKDNKKDFFLFSLATLCTMSRTGISAFAIMVLYRFFKKNVLYLLPLVPVFLLAAEYAMLIRGTDSATHLDRFIYFKQTYNYILNTDVFNILFGSSPGISLHMDIIPEFEWNVSNFENMRDLNGVYPFMFHSVYLRFFFTWGVVGTLVYLLFFVCQFFRARNEHYKLFCLLTLVQSISLSTLTLQNVSVLFILMLISFMYNERVLAKQKTRFIRVLSTNM